MKPGDIIRNRRSPLGPFYEVVEVDPVTGQIYIPNGTIQRLIQRPEAYVIVAPEQFEKDKIAFVVGKFVKNLLKVLPEPCRQKTLRQIINLLQELKI